MTIDLDVALENTEEQVKAQKWLEVSKEADKKLKELQDELGVRAVAVRIQNEVGEGIIAGEQMGIIWMPKPKGEEKE